MGTVINSNGEQASPVEDPSPTSEDGDGQDDGKVGWHRRLWRWIFSGRYARRAASKHAGTSPSLDEYRAWKDKWWLARHLLSLGVAVVWALLTALVAWQVLQAFHEIKDGDRVVLVGTFLAWMTVTTAIQKSLKPHRAKDDDSRGESLVERVVSLLEKAADRLSDR